MCLPGLRVFVAYLLRSSLVPKIQKITPTRLNIKILSASRPLAGSPKSHRRDNLTINLKPLRARTKKDAFLPSLPLRKGGIQGRFYLHLIDYFAISGSNILD